MDQSKYADLTAKLRDHTDTEIAHRSFMQMFLMSIQSYFNEETVKGWDACAVGSINPIHGFDKGEWRSYGNTTEFAIQVRFFDSASVQIFAHAVPFNASVEANVLTVTCQSTHSKVRLSGNECMTKEGKQAVIDLLDQPVMKAVEDALRN
jgi:hypothetical protein